MRSETVPIQVTNYRKNGEIINSLGVISYDLTKALIETIGLNMLISRSSQTPDQRAIQT